MSNNPRIHYSQVDYILELAKDADVYATKEEVEKFSFDEYMTIKDLLEEVIRYKDRLN